MGRGRRGREGTVRDGTVWPGTEIDVVGENDMPLPFGATGRIRVRTRCMVDSYLDDPGATRRRFRDGWFHSGDLGILHSARQLQIVAREDELLNIGGLKLVPSQLEEIVLKDPGVKDAGVCSLRNAVGIDEVRVGVVAEGGDAELLELVERAFRPFRLGAFGIGRLADIPRNANGKVERAALKAALSAEHRRARAGGMTARALPRRSW